MCQFVDGVLSRFWKEFRNRPFKTGDWRVPSVSVNWTCSLEKWRGPSLYWLLLDRFSCPLKWRSRNEPQYLMLIIGLSKLLYHCNMFYENVLKGLFFCSVELEMARDGHGHMFGLGPGHRLEHRHEHCRRTGLALGFATLVTLASSYLLRLGVAAAASQIFSDSSFCLSTSLSPPSTSNSPSKLIWFLVERKSKPNFQHFSRNWFSPCGVCTFVMIYRLLRGCVMRMRSVHPPTKYEVDIISLCSIFTISCLYMAR